MFQTQSADLDASPEALPPSREAARAGRVASRRRFPPSVVSAPLRRADGQSQLTCRAAQTAGTAAVPPAELDTAAAHRRMTVNPAD